MVFSSLIFLFMFLPITLIIYYICPRKFKNLVILIMSLIFYAWGEPIYIFLMLGSILIDYIGGLMIESNKEDSEKRTAIFITVIVLNLSFLFFFKYYGFLIDNINGIFGVNLQIRNLPLPLGISFYTFQLISYVADVYMGKVVAQRNIINFGSYITMFPQLVAGPIVQYNDIEDQLNNRSESIDKFGEGVERFIGGMGKKVLIANNIGMIWTSIKGLPIEELSILTAWIGIIAFTLQIYFDFSGYSDMAIGLGKMFGFEFLENFNHPYMSKSISEFWRRWHISLGSWFRDYIYIPLGGNRRGKAVQFRNLLIVWFATGLWHGASWNFVIWGLYFGVFIFLEKLFLGKILNKVPNAIAHIYTVVLVIISWVFFDTSKVKDALNYIKIMFGMGKNIFMDNMAKYTLKTNLILIVIAIICSTPLIKNLIAYIKNKYKLKGVYIVIAINMLVLILSIVYLVSESYNPFLYFRF
ncbi:MBOAT family O-acyltransferase [Clostridium sp. UBA5119]|uniref:MBOAT family O-acyltransferase n=1 Tax=Clostridium sp. UBA5119 TaxID=1946366 RepID=UPI003216F635